MLLQYRDLPPRLTSWRFGRMLNCVPSLHRPVPCVMSLVESLNWGSTCLGMNLSHRLPCLDLLPLAQSPFMDCCSACLQAQDLPQLCPVALNLCAHWQRHGGLRPCPHDGRRSPGRVERKLGQPPESDAAAQASETRGDGQGDRPNQQVSRSFLPLVLRHESQLQAMAVEDQVIFLAGRSQRSFTHFDQGHQWKDLQQKKQTQSALRNFLFQTVTRELLSRKEKVMKAQPQDEAWQGLLTAQLLTTQGAWNYMQWCPQQKKLIPMERSPIAMDQMRTMIQASRSSLQIQVWIKSALGWCRYRVAPIDFGNCWAPGVTRQFGYSSIQPPETLWPRPWPSNWQGHPPIRSLPSDVETPIAQWWSDLLCERKLTCFSMGGAAERVCQMEWFGRWGHCIPHLAQWWATWTLCLWKLRVWGFAVCLG